MDLAAVVPAVPGEVAGERALRLVHVGVGPFPDAVELRLPVQLHGDHHPVGHALGADVLVLDVRHVGHLAVDRVVDALVVVAAVEELLPGGLDLRVDLGVGAAEIFGEEVAVPAGFECALRRGCQGCHGGDEGQDEEQGGQQVHRGEEKKDQGVTSSAPQRRAVPGVGPRLGRPVPREGGTGLLPRQRNGERGLTVAPEGRKSGSAR